MRILALDPATAFGWAYGSIDTGIETGTWDLSIKKDESSEMRLIRLRTKLMSMAHKGVDVMVYEAARTSRFPATLKVQAKIEAVFQMWAADCGIPFEGFSAKQIKLYATGDGNAGKDAMLGAAIHKFGVDCEGDDNRADALALWHMAYALYGDGDGIPAAVPVNKQRKPKAKGVTRKTKVPA